MMKNHTNNNRINSPSENSGIKPIRQNPTAVGSGSGKSSYATLAARMSVRPDWSMIEPNLERWIELRNGADPRAGEEERIRSILHEELEADESNPTEVAASDVATIAMVLDGPRFDHTADRDRWYPESACREGIHYPGSVNRHFIGDRRRR